MTGHQPFTHYAMMPVEHCSEVVRKAARASNTAMDLGYCDALQDLERNTINMRAFLRGSISIGSARHWAREGAKAFQRIDAILDALEQREGFEAAEQALREIAKRAADGSEEVG